MCCFLWSFPSFLHVFRSHLLLYSKAHITQRCSCELIQFHFMWIRKFNPCKINRIPFLKIFERKKQTLMVRVMNHVCAGSAVALEMHSGRIRCCAVIAVLWFLLLLPLSIPFLVFSFLFFSFLSFTLYWWSFCYLITSHFIISAVLVKKNLSPSSLFDPQLSPYLGLTSSFEKVPQGNNADIVCLALLSDPTFKFHTIRGNVKIQSYSSMAGSFTIMYIVYLLVKVLHSSFS